MKNTKCNSKPRHSSAERIKHFSSARYTSYRDGWLFFACLRDRFSLFVGTDSLEVSAHFFLSPSSLNIVDSSCRLLGKQLWMPSSFKPGLLPFKGATNTKTCRQRQRKVSVSDNTERSDHRSSLLLLMPLFVELVFTPLTSSLLNLPFILSKCKHKADTEAKGKNRKSWRKGDSHTPAPLSWLCSCTIQKQPAQIRPAGRGTSVQQPTVPQVALCWGERGDTASAMCRSSLRHGRFSPFHVLGFASMAVHLHHCQTAEHVWLLCAPCSHYGGKRQLSLPLAFSKSCYSWIFNDGNMAPASINAKFWNENNLDKFQNDVETFIRAHSGHIFDLGSLSRRHCQHVGLHVITTD